MSTSNYGSLNVFPFEKSDKNYTLIKILNLSLGGQYKPSCLDVWMSTSQETLRCVNLFGLKSKEKQIN